MDFAKARAIRYYEDCTNDTPAYTRNRIRKEILPALFSEDENVHHKFSEFSQTLLAAWEVVETQVKNFIREHCEAKEDGVFFELSEFGKLPPFLQTETLFLLLKPYDLSKANVLEIEKIFASDKPNLEVRFLKKFTVLKEYEKAGFLFTAPKDLPAETEITGLGKFSINDELAAIVSKKPENHLINDDEICYNSRMLPVLIRSRKPGDKIELESGGRKVKDLLIDRKIGISKRSQILVLEKDGEILSVIGIRKSAKLKEMQNCDIIIKVVKNNG
jgi:tRNA(Ile)-lysidine synthase